jgi:hypothetical protein
MTPLESEAVKRGIDRATSGGWEILGPNRRLLE